jgi:hypothetical protein
LRKELYVLLYYAVEYVIIYDLIKLGNQKRNKRLKRRPENLPAKEEKKRKELQAQVRKPVL